MKNVTLIVEGKRKMPENAFIVISDYTLKSMMMLRKYFYKLQNKRRNIAQRLYARRYLVRQSKNRQ